MSSRKLIFLLLIFSCQLGKSQENTQQTTGMRPFPNGVYLNLEQFRDQLPAFQADFKKVLRSNADIFMMGGTHIKFESMTDSITEKYIRTKIYAYVKGDTVYMNAFPLKMGFGYMQAITSGNYIVFNAKGEANGVIGAAGSGSELTVSSYYILSLRTGNVRELSKAYIVERLKEYETLLQMFSNEGDPENLQTILKYVNQLNAVTSPKAVNKKK